MEVLVERLPAWSSFSRLKPVSRYRRGSDGGGFVVVYFLEASSWKSCDRLLLWRNVLVSSWRFVWSMDGEEV
jgi:hypothetical protein